MRNRISPVRLASAAALVAASAVPVSAQIDPLNFMKLEKPNVIFVVETSSRMQRTAPTDNTSQTTSRNTSDYIDPVVYTRGNAWDATLGVTAANTTTNFRRRYVNMKLVSAGTDKFEVDRIDVVTDQDHSISNGVDAVSSGVYSRFDVQTRLAIARAAMYQAVTENQNVARFGLIRTRQKNVSPATTGNSGAVVSNLHFFQQTPNDGVTLNGRWKTSRGSVDSSTNNGAYSGNPAIADALLLKADSNTASDLLSILGRAPTLADGGTSTTRTLIPAGNDDATTFDTPVKLLLDDAYSEVKRLIAINSDPTCRNTVVVLIVGGGEGTTTAGATNASLETVAKTFVDLNNSDRRIPIHVIAIAPPASDSADLAKIATSNGGSYTEITKAQIDAALASSMQQKTVGVTAPAGTLVVPEAVQAISYAIQHAFVTSTDLNDGVNTPTAAGKSTEFQVTSPIIGTVNLNQAKDINGNSLPAPQPPDVKDKQGTVIPQRNNVMITTGVTMPGFDGTLRAFRVYKPVVDATQPSGWKFSADGTRLWIAATPLAAQRNLYTSTVDGTMIPLNTDPGNIAVLAALMNLNTTDATTVISAVRALPLGAVIDSTPAVMNPPSLDPPPEDSYPGFAADHKDRRTLLWFGTNRGILTALDARSGLEVWGYIPLNLLPKLRTLLDGQSVGKFDYFEDGSPKISDVRLSGICPADQPKLCWRTHLIVGQGPGGTFYQSFDVTLDGLESVVTPDSNDTTALLNWFSNSTRVTLNWSFPDYKHFNVCGHLAAPCSPIQTSGDLDKDLATDVEKTVGQTWSDPAVGQITSAAGPYAVLLGSGFLPYTTQQRANRGGKVAGTTFYIADAKTGEITTSSDVASDGVNEDVDDCLTNAAIADVQKRCQWMKNALQTDPVATGPSDQRYITKAYLGDLDGNVWRFDIGLDGSNKPKVNAKNKLYSAGKEQPIFSSMATVNVGGTNQYVFFGTGSDLLPVTDKNTIYRLVGVLDNGAATGTASLSIPLAKSNTLSSDERVTAFPAVAGDIVFFTTTTFDSASLCTAPNANLYALTFIGGAAYDTDNNNKFDKNDKTLVTTIAGQRATAPFIVDQHLVFGTKGNVSMFGDPNDFNNGIGQAGVRILSWREVR